MRRRIFGGNASRVRATIRRAMSFGVVANDIFYRSRRKDRYNSALYKMVKRMQRRPIAKPALPSSHKEQKSRQNLSLVFILAVFILFGLKLTIVLFSPPQQRQERRKLTPVPEPKAEESLLVKFARDSAVPIGSDDNLVLVTFTDYTINSSELVNNWALTLKSHNLPCLIGVCSPTMPSEQPPHCVAVHTPHPRCIENPRVGRWFLIDEILRSGTSVFNMDSDVILMRNPVDYIAELFDRHPLASVFTSSDANTGAYVHAGPGGSRGGETVGDVFHTIIPNKNADAKGEGSRWKAAYPDTPHEEGFVERPEIQWRTQPYKQDVLLETLKTGAKDLGLDTPDNCTPHQFNTGLQIWRISDRTTNFMARWLPVLPTGFPADDQWIMNDIAKTAAQYCAVRDAEKADAIACGGDRMLNSMNGGMMCLGILPLVQWSNGMVYSLAREHEQYGIRPFTFHATYSSNKPSKIREEGLFLDPPEYYQGRFLVYDNKFTLPEQPYTYEKHYALVQQQLKQLRSALALAKATSRVLVLPEMVASCESFFFPGQDCVILGHRVRLPHIPPLDHWLVHPFMQETREPGFLRNPRFRLEGMETSDPAGADSKNGQLLRVTDIESYTNFEPQFLQEIDGKLGAWCCTLQDGKPFKALYDWDKPLELVPYDSFPDRKPGA